MGDAISQATAKKRSGGKKVIEKEFEEHVHHPNHYTWLPGIECVEVTRHFNFCMGNAIKYIWRADHKGRAIEDLQKAIEYLEIEITRRGEQT